MECIMLLDPFRLAIALFPIAVYLFLIGLVNLRRRPFLISGGSDLAVVGLALSGLACVGPLDLLRPEPATAEFGNFIWLLLLAFYWLSLVLIVLLARPRLVVYNTTIEELHPVLAEAASRLDSDARWAGNSLALPQLGLQLHLESFELMRNVSLISSGGQQSLEGWRRLARELAPSLRRVRVKPNPRGFAIVAFALLLVAASVSQMVRHPLELAEAAKEVFAY
jgi:hypothetical protein